jgi:hypothetical protein
MKPAMRLGVRELVKNENGAAKELVQTKLSRDAILGNSLQSDLAPTTRSGSPSTKARP